MGHKISVKGYVFIDGKLVKKPQYASVSQKLKQRKSKRVRATRRTGE